MLKIVVDTNVLVSSLIRRGKPHEFILRINGIDVRLISSDVLMSELTSVLAEERIKKYVTERDVERFLRYVGRRTTLVKIRSRFKVVKEDPKDDTVLNTAYSGGAEYTVSGDKHLVPLREFKGIKIVTVSEMLGILKKI
ncbi:MAG: putative toxin-antitoxin system toxin component, PIN family [Candidatus Bathyarchaeota archaeon]|jgi:putative PIN family toxin of toxin-antitoxin system|nr:putative toxin-antitoxin system toxin component, PIN family [Candidatus Bathyarchaeota archaeon]